MFSIEPRTTPYDSAPGMAAQPTTVPAPLSEIDSIIGSIIPAMS